MKPNHMKFSIPCLALLATLPVCAQLGGQSSGGSAGSTAVQLPLSGRTGQSGSVTTTQTALPGTTTSVNTLNTSVQVQGPYAGSTGVADKPFSGRLSLKDAIDRALTHNLGSV